MSNNSLDFFKKILHEHRLRNKQLSHIMDEMIHEEDDVVRQLHEYDTEQLNWREKIADKVAKFGGSRAFLASFAGFMLLWMVVNLFLLQNSFDPYPFTLLNLFLSTITALQAPVILMSQNREEKRDRQRTENDYLVNLKSAVEIRSLHQKLDVLLTDEMSSLYNTQTKQGELLQKILDQLHKHDIAMVKGASNHMAAKAKKLHTAKHLPASQNPHA